MSSDRIAAIAARVTFWIALAAGLISAFTVAVTQAVPLLLMTALALATAGYARQVMLDR